MRLTHQTNYAIRALMYCELNDGKLSRVADIAAAYNIPELVLFKIIKNLVDGGMIETVRGRGGGIRLHRPAREITLLDVARATEESFAMAECFSANTTCPLADGCDLNAAYQEALDAFFEVLDSHTIADITQKRRSMRTRLGIAEVRR